MVFLVYTIYAHLIPSSRKPLPLTTVELQKAASRLLRLTPKRALDVRHFELSRIVIESGIDC